MGRRASVNEVVWELEALLGPLSRDVQPTILGLAFYRSLALDFEIHRAWLDSRSRQPGSLLFCGGERARRHLLEHPGAYDAGGVFWFARGSRWEGFAVRRHPGSLLPAVWSGVRLLGELHPVLAPRLPAPPEGVGVTGRGSIALAVRALGHVRTDDSHGVTRIRRLAKAHLEAGGALQDSVDRNLID